MQFHWDRYGKMDENSSCWIRVSSPWAGSNYGGIFIPRIGQEVIIDFINGDPDYPIITGRVYNADQMPPWQLPANKTQSGFKTRSSKNGTPGDGMGKSPGMANAIRFEDMAGKEQLWVHAQKDQLTEVEHDENKWVGNNRTKTVDANETNSIGIDQTSKVGQDRDFTVRRNDTLRVGADKCDSVTGIYLIETGEMLRLVCGKTAVELRADGTVAVICEQFNITANQYGEINTLNNTPLHLNPDGGQGWTVAGDEEMEGNINAGVEAKFSDPGEGE